MIENRYAALSQELVDTDRAGAFVALDHVGGFCVSTADPNVAHPHLFPSHLESV
jgi:hypothetical protein